MTVRYVDPGRISIHVPLQPQLKDIRTYTGSVSRTLEWYHNLRITGDGVLRRQYEHLAGTRGPHAGTRETHAGGMDLWISL